MSSKGGEPIRSIQGVWNAARTAGPAYGVASPITSDPPRSATSNVPRPALRGHGDGRARAREHLRRYEITYEAMLREAADKLAAYHRAESVSRVRVGSERCLGGASGVAVSEVTALEAASGFEPENRGFAVWRTHAGTQGIQRISRGIARFMLGWIGLEEARFGRDR
jgi:hypothetical protein